MAMLAGMDTERATVTTTGSTEDAKDFCCQFLYSSEEVFGHVSFDSGFIVHIFLSHGTTDSMSSHR